MREWWWCLMDRGMRLLVVVFEGQSDEGVVVVFGGQRDEGVVVVFDGQRDEVAGGGV